MTKKIVKKEKQKNTKQVVKKPTIEEIKERVKMLQAQCEPNKILREFNDLFEGYQNSTGKIKKQKEEQINKIADSVVRINGLDNHYPLAETIKELNRPLIIEMARSIIKEYDCKTSSEKALVETIVCAYGRILDYSSKFSVSTNIEYLSKEKNGYYSMFSKEVDRAYRQFISALTLLKEIKSPSLNIKVKTNTAFIAQNQQLNNNQKPDENNKA